MRGCQRCGQRLWPTVGTSIACQTPAMKHRPCECHGTRRGKHGACSTWLSQSSLASAIKSCNCLCFSERMWETFSSTAHCLKTEIKHEPSRKGQPSFVYDSEDLFNEVGPGVLQALTTSASRNPLPGTASTGKRKETGLTRESS